ncbi:ribonuclease H family protein (plasmid) [Carnobacterium viridans]|uniref:Ribonuclease H n=1 Tax=Carnobacterium viridans TaxID=174587 RepID=A0A1H1CJD8_9LACT|nr:ribonuclease H family protein [Carnobacterium viridans]UDE96370.1 ribonuclease H family protein [Carnobacterium viridans]SDQ64304.1 viroplasmin and RNaseH domain-containing protein [Carnobacterium viridans]
MGKFYAVRTGRKTGIFETWHACELQVKGYPGSQYKSFQNRLEAEEYLDNSTIEKTESPGTALHIYVDGSYSKAQNRAGFGCVFVKNDTILKEVSLETPIISNDNLWNVSAEIAGVLYAVEWCVKKEVPSVTIFYDYEGLSSWYDGSWKANKQTTKNYVKKMNELKKHINISFSKVKAHSGDFFNEKADFLAKKAINNVKESIKFNSNLITNENIDIYLNLELFNKIVGVLNTEEEKTIIICKGFHLNDRIINKLAKYFWKKDKKMLKDLANIKITFDVKSMILNIEYSQKKIDGKIIKLIQLEGK